MQSPFSFQSIHIFSVWFYSSPCLQRLPINRESQISVSKPPLSPKPQTEYLQMPILGPYPMVSQKSQSLKHQFIPCLHLLAFKTSSSSSLPFPDTWYHIPPYHPHRSAAQSHPYSARLAVMNWRPICMWPLDMYIKVQFSYLLWENLEDLTVSHGIK